MFIAPRHIRSSMAILTGTFAKRPYLRALMIAVALAGDLVAPLRAVAEDAPAPPAPRYVVPSVEELAMPQPPMQGASDSNTGEAICLMIESAARANGLPLEFFARLIWQESRFESGAVGPTTRSGARAQGIAQFMPGTA